MRKPIVERIREVTVVQFEGEIISGEARSTFQSAVEEATSDSEVIIIDLSEVPVIDGETLAAFDQLQQWAYDKHVELKFFNPRHLVQLTMSESEPPRHFNIIALDELTRLLERRDEQTAQIVT
jgi:anti-anti-sigma regulatory factor